MVLLAQYKPTKAQINSQMKVIICIFFLIIIIIIIIIKNMKYLNKLIREKNELLNILLFLLKIYGL